jgi:hypothetical protein
MFSGRAFRHLAPMLAADELATERSLSTSWSSAGCLWSTFSMPQEVSKSIYSPHSPAPWQDEYLRRHREPKLPICDCTMEEMFRDLKSTLGLRQAYLKHEARLARLLLGYQVAYLILSLIGLHVPRRWHRYLSSRPRLSLIWLALQSLPLLNMPRHSKVWRRHIWPALWLESG